MRLKKSVGKHVIPKKILEEKFRNFVKEDVGQGDLTTLTTVPSGTIVEAKILAKIEGTDYVFHFSERFMNEIEVECPLVKIKFVDNLLEKISVQETDKEKKQV